MLLRMIFFFIKMPRSPSTRSDKAMERIKHFPEFKFDGFNVICTVCNIVVNFERKSSFDRHLQSKYHVSRKDNPQAYDIFYLDLLKFIIANNITWYQVNQPAFRDFIEKYTSFEVPEESWLRKNYLRSVYENHLTDIRRDLKDAFICLSVDESTDSLGRQILSTLLWNLKSEEPTQPKLVSSKLVDEININTVVDAVERTLEWLWGSPYEHKHKFILFVTDGFEYMLKAGVILKNRYRDMIHYTCTAHAFHLISEKVRRSFPDVNNLTSNMKTFLKAPNRRKIFQEHLPNIPFPPKPIIAHYDTWIEEVLYYHKYYDELKEFSLKLNQSDNSSIERIQKHFSSEQLYTDLDYIKTNFEVLVKEMKSLQNNDLTLRDTLSHIDRVFDKLEEAKGIIGLTVYHKLHTVFDRNPGYETMCEIQKKMNSDEDLDKETKCLFYAPLVSIDVKKSFSSLKWLFTPRRSCMAAENLEKLIILFHDYSLNT